MCIRTLSVLAVFSAAAASAATVYPVQIGGATGLTANYIAQGAGAVCAAGAGNCVTGSAGGFAEANYENRLFQNATPALASPNPFTGYAQTGGVAANSKLGQFNMIANDTTGTGASADFWSSYLGPDTITVPVGVQDVSDVWLMLDNIWGAAGANDTNVTFNFSDTSKGATTNSVKVNLVNAGTNGSAASGQVGSALECSAPCSGFATGSPLASGTVGGVNFLTETLFSQAYSTAIGAFAGTAGNVSLHGEDFTLAGLFPNESNLWLTSIQVSETSGGAPGVSNTALSAITVDAVVPEPSTILLFMSGLGALGFARFRRK